MKLAKGMPLTFERYGLSFSQLDHEVLTRSRRSKCELFWMRRATRVRSSRRRNSASVALEMFRLAVC